MRRPLRFISFYVYPVVFGHQRSSSGGSFCFMSWCLKFLEQLIRLTICFHGISTLLLSLIVNFVFPTSVFLSGNLFLIAPLPLGEIRQNIRSVKVEKLIEIERIA